MARCGLSTEEVAERAGVDPKTLDRWIAGRVPHPRNRRTLAAVLGVHPIDLWPDTDPFQRLVPHHLDGVLAVFTSRSGFLAEFSPESLFADATAISIAGLSNNLLCQHYADHRLEELLCLGTKVTCLFLDPAGSATAAREVEEGYESGHLAALTKLNMSLLQRLKTRIPATAAEHLFLGTYDQTIRFNIMIVEHPDDTIAVAQPYLPHSRGVESPTLVIRKLPEGGLFETFHHVFDELRNVANEC